MKRYRIRAEYFDQWAGKDPDASPDIIITETEAAEIAAGWDKTLEDVIGQLEEVGSVRISIDNGNRFVTPAEALDGMHWDIIAHYMDDETREAVHNELAPCNNLEFLRRYLELAPGDLIIG